MAIERKLKENQHVMPEIDLEHNRVLFHVKGYSAPLVLDMAKVHPDIAARAALVGMAQVRIVDAAAVGVADKDGNILPESERIEMKYDNMAELIAHYHSGTTEWSRVSAGGTGAKSITLEAIARVQGCTYDEAQALVARHAERKYGGDTKRAMEKLRASPTVQAAILAIRQERLPKPAIDADADLAELVAE